MNPLTYTIPEAAEALRVSRGFLYKDIMSGRLQTYTIGSRRFVSAEALASYIRDRETETKQAAVTA